MMNKKNGKDITKHVIAYMEKKITNAYLKEFEKLTGLSKEKLKVLEGKKMIKLKNLIKESTKSYEAGLKKMARDKQLKMLSKKDKETLLKIANLMKKANEGTIQATDEQMNRLKERFNQITNENWFSDLGAKAKQTYIKLNPNSKYAQGVASGEKEAPMTGKEKQAAAADRKSVV